MSIFELIILVFTIPLASLYLSTISIRFASLIFLNVVIYYHMIDSTSLFLSTDLEILGRLFQLPQIFETDDILLSSTIFSFQDSLLATTIILYNNAETEKLQILSDNKGKTGIYMWIHKESGKRYVGSALELSKRLKFYYSLPELKRVNNYISRALLHHTHSAFSLTILEIIDISSKSVEETRKLILEREQYYIDTLMPEYNILQKAGSSLGYKHSEESLVKMSETKKGDKSLMFGKTGKDHPFFGKTHTVESITKISLASLGKTHSASGPRPDASPSPRGS